MAWLTDVTRQDKTGIKRTAHEMVTDVHVDTHCGQNVNTCQISVKSDWATITESVLLSDCINCYGCFGA